MHIIKTVLKGSQFTIEFLKNQQNPAPTGIDIDTNVITADFKILTKFPVGTIFAVSDIKWGDVTSTVLGSPRALVFEQTTYAEGTNEDVNYFIDWAIGSDEYKNEQILELGAQFNEIGYTVDVNLRLESYKKDESGTLRERIIRMYPCPTEEAIGFHIEPDVWYLLIRNIMRGENTLLIGPTGAGKTELVSHIARAMSLPLSIQDMGTVQDAQSALLGVHRLNKEGHSDFDYAPFVGHVQRDGIVLLDELNR